MWELACNNVANTRTVVNECVLRFSSAYRNSLALVAYNAAVSIQEKDTGPKKDKISGEMGMLLIQDVLNLNQKM